MPHIIEVNSLAGLLDFLGTVLEDVLGDQPEPQKPEPETEKPKPEKPKKEECECQKNEVKPTREIDIYNGKLDSIIPINTPYLRIGNLPVVALALTEDKRTILSVVPSVNDGFVAVKAGVHPHGKPVD